MITTKDKLEFVYQMARHSQASLSDLQRIMRLAGTLQRIAEEHCNEPVCRYGKHSEDGECAKQDNLEKKLLQLCLQNGMSARFQRNPRRGCVVKIAVPDGYTNDMGREGICVPA